MRKTGLGRVAADICYGEMSRICFFYLGPVNAIVRIS